MTNFQWPMVVRGSMTNDQFLMTNPGTASAIGHSPIGHWSFLDPIRVILLPARTDPKVQGFFAVAPMTSRSMKAVLYLPLRKAWWLRISRHSGTVVLLG